MPTRSTARGISAAHLAHGARPRPPPPRPSLSRRRTSPRRPRSGAPPPPGIPQIVRSPQQPPPNVPAVQGADSSGTPRRSRTPAPGSDPPSPGSRAQVPHAFVRITPLGAPRTGTSRIRSHHPSRRTPMISTPESPGHLGHREAVGLPLHAASASMRLILNGLAHPARWKRHPAAASGRPPPWGPAPTTWPRADGGDT